jgi:hypothetical protein
MIVKSFGAPSMKFWAKRQTPLHHSLNQIANLSQNPLMFPTTKISKRRYDMPATNTDTRHPNISDQIIKDKHYNFEFRNASVEELNKNIVVYQQ